MGWDGFRWPLTIDGPILGRVGITLSSTVTFFNVARTLLTLTFSRAWGEIKEEYGVGSPKEISQNQPHPGVAPPETDEEVSTLFILPMITNVAHYGYYLYCDYYDHGGDENCRWFITNTTSGSSLSCSSRWMVIWWYVMMKYDDVLWWWWWW